jgi:hypothetical protein
MAGKYNIPEHLKRVKNIAEGAVSALLGENQELHDARFSICKTCTRYKERLGVCSICGCALNLKLRVQSEHCPADQPKW